MPDLHPERITVLLINGMQDTIDMLRIVLGDAGFRVADAQARDVRHGHVDLAELVRHHDASVVLFDVAIPYQENWQALESRRADPALAGVPFVITTTNQRALQELVGPTGALEVVGKPYDLDRVVEAVRRAASRTRGAGR
jgi:CheY-like chemotaxis protein